MKKKLQSTTIDSTKPMQRAVKTRLAPLGDFQVKTLSVKHLEETILIGREIQQKKYHIVHFVPINRIIISEKQFYV